MNAGTCWGKNTIGPRGRSVEKAPGSDFNFFNYPSPQKMKGHDFIDGKELVLTDWVCEIIDSGGDALISY